VDRLNVSKDKAMELANLVLLAYGMYEDFTENTILATEDQWRFSPEVHGSIERKYDYHNSLYAPLNGTPIDYRILAEFWHTDRPVGKLRLETVPFGFIALKTNENEQETRSDEIYVVFRGTLNSQEWAANSRFKKAEVLQGVPGAGFVHRGFNTIFETSFTDRLKSSRGIYTSLKRKVFRVQPPPEIRQQSIRETLESILFNSELVSPEAKIYITGHSLGGALALLAGRVLANAGRNIAGGDNPTSKNLYSDKLAICTFGAPRVGDNAFKSVFNDISVFRYVNTEDIVPTVPPATSRLLGADMILTPEGMRSYKSDGVTSIAGIYQATAGSVQRGQGKTEQKPFTHVGEQRTFTLTQDSISFNHNHQETYREGILLYHEGQVAG
jgi:triacylglycerol lipase